MYEVWDEGRIVYISDSYSKVFDFWQDLVRDYFKKHPHSRLPNISYCAMQNE